MTGPWSFSSGLWRGAGRTVVVIRQRDRDKVRALTTGVGSAGLGLDQPVGFPGTMMPEAGIAPSFRFHWSRIFWYDPSLKMACMACCIALSSSLFFGSTAIPSGAWAMGLPAMAKDAESCFT